MFKIKTIRQLKKSLSYKYKLLCEETISNLNEYNNPSAYFNSIINAGNPEYNLTILEFNSTYEYFIPKSRELRITIQLNKDPESITLYNTDYKENPDNYDNLINVDICYYVNNNCIGVDTFGEITIFISSMKNYRKTFIKYIIEKIPFIVCTDCEQKLVMKNNLFCYECLTIGQKFDCSICKNGDIKIKCVSIKKCGHIFHNKCILNWLINYKNTCPICRDLFDKDDLILY
jgi:hypothetical protein